MAFGPTASPWGDPSERVVEAWEVAGIDQADFAARIPLGRAGRPDEVAWAILFMASDAASYITGQTFAVEADRASAAFPIPEAPLR
jgi:NAD(P)-dependent dehydrogenase (short-subunit alcohol dehydrogenase family)